MDDRELRAGVDVEVLAFLFCGRTAEAIDDEVFRDGSVMSVSSNRESREASGRGRRWAGVRVEELEFALAVFVDALPGSVARVGAIWTDTGVEPPVFVQLDHLGGYAWLDAASCGGSADDRSADGEIEFFGDCSDRSGWSSDERDLGQEQVGELLRVGAFVIEDAHCRAEADARSLHLVGVALVLDGSEPFLYGGEHDLEWCFLFAWGYRYENVDIVRYPIQVAFVDHHVIAGHAH